MSNLIDSTPESQDTDSAIVAMFDQMLLDDNLAVVVDTHDGYTQYLLVDISSDVHGFLIDTYDTRVSAYRAAIDCLIELCIEAWDKGGEE